MITPLDASRLEITHAASLKTIPPSNELVFGQTFTDHMLTCTWSVARGWEAPQIKAYGPLALDPASTVLHYAPTLFEGMKAYKDKNGVPRLFRPDKNMERMKRGCARLAFPGFDADVMISLISKLVSVDEQWIPTDPGCSLYIRPTMIGTRASLGVGPSTEVLLFVIMSPVGPYYPTGNKPVSLLASTQDVRAWPGGTGGHKLGSNYAGGVTVQQEAAEQGYQQILWLFGPSHQLTEVGMMNLLCSFKRPDGSVELVTPPLADLILPGVTRDSVLSLARTHADPNNPMRIEGLPERLIVSERDVDMAEVCAAAAAGTLLEMFGTGTAAVISSVERIGYEGTDIPVPCGPAGLGEIAAVMLREIRGRHLGEIESEWSVVVS